MEKKATSAAKTASTSKNRKNTQETFAGKVARKCDYQESKWTLVDDSLMKFTKKELARIKDIRLWLAKAGTDDEYWWIKVRYTGKDGSLYEVKFTPDLKLTKKAKHGDYLDPEKFLWYSITDGKQVLERAMSIIITPEEEVKEEEKPKKKAKKGNYDVPF